MYVPLIPFENFVPIYPKLFEPVTSTATKPCLLGKMYGCFQTLRPSKQWMVEVRSKSENRGHKIARIISFASPNQSINFLFVGVGVRYDKGRVYSSV